MARGERTLSGLTLARGAWDRAGDLRGDVELLDRLLTEQSTRVLPLRGETAPVSRLDATGSDLALAWRSPVAEDVDRLTFFLGYAARTGRGGGSAGSAAYVAVVEARSEPEGDPGWLGLRQVALGLSDEDASAFTTAVGLANWHRHHGRCSRCGAPTEPIQAGWVRRCPEDGSEHFPRTDPAVIMSVVDSCDNLLLARGSGFRSKGMSVLAGFVEPGESLAAAVAREVAEEVGLTVGDVRYLGDQPWPFPSSLMIGFSARVDGERPALHLHDGEIEAARWFSRDELSAAVGDGSVRISSRVSIARRIVEHWFGGPIECPEP